MQVPKAIITLKRCHGAYLCNTRVRNLVIVQTINGMKKKTIATIINACWTPDILIPPFYLL
ncbi:hypothetical protein SERIO_v1c01050 [Spiroplasma eriocheiris]|uniref:Uncharacterized protein n=1 Tax=Spiroplasma eriocheiris TaxID=315358 RepID=A0A0H3XHG4_9MOLU|nr:hypothetical protein SPE_0105 [Spiroplasma eriocheiris CCTCC M 207170]AKM53705.1 hypothetical protein SERIO_v1c01050 [Spiroplasma eriocheiris]